MRQFPSRIATCNSSSAGAPHNERDWRRTIAGRSNFLFVCVGVCLCCLFFRCEGLGETLMTGSQEGVSHGRKKGRKVCLS